MRIVALRLSKSTYAYHVHVSPAIHALFEPPKRVPITVAGLFHKSYGYLHSKWEGLRSSPPNSFRGRLAHWGEKLAQRTQRHEEVFLKSVPWAVEEEQLEGIRQSRTLAAIVVRYPASEREADVSQSFRTFVQDRRAYHSRWARLWTTCIPLSVAFALVPGPNVPLAYNIYRLFGHYRAYKGSCTLEQMWPHLQFRPDQDLDNIMKHYPSPLPETEKHQSDVKREKDDDEKAEKVLAQVERITQMDGLAREMLRARRQLSATLGRSSR